MNSVLLVHAGMQMYPLALAILSAPAAPFGSGTAQMICVARSLLFAAATPVVAQKVEA